MGVFYNPQGPIPIGQMGFDTKVQTSPVGGGRSRQPKEVKRDLAAEKADAWKQATIVGAGDPIKTADTMTSLGYPEDAAKYKHQVAQTEEQNLKVAEMETQHEVEQLRVASDLLRSGRADLAMKVANKSIPDIENQFIRMDYNPKKDEVVFETHAGDTGSMHVEDLIKAATSSEKQFTEMAAYKRTQLSTMKDPKTMSPTDLLGASMVKRMEIEGEMKKGLTEAEVIKMKPHLELSPLEKEMILKWQQGDLGAVVAAATQANPGMFKIYGAKTPEEAAGIIARIFKSTQEQLRAQTSPSADPKAGGAGAPVIPRRPGTSVSVTEKSHPSFKAPQGAVFGKDNVTGKRVYSTDGGKTVYDAETGEVIK